ncbi:MAG: peptidogalycan biosysnthesis protein [Rhodocyclaceae bacterium]|nr:peptidogalycan biosysnthesis protein [Rhodocyclaceae bacterium]
MRGLQAPAGSRRIAHAARREVHWFNSRLPRLRADFPWVQRGEAETWLRGRAVAESGLRIEVRHGDEIDAPPRRALYRHYRDTFQRHGNHPAFKLEPFLGVGRTGGGAWWRSSPGGGAAGGFGDFHRDDAALYGRHWGTDIASPGAALRAVLLPGHRIRHRHGLQRFEPGAGRAQAGARLRAGDDLVRLLDRRSAHARHRGELPAPRGQRDCRTTRRKWRAAPAVKAAQGGE